MKRGLSGVEYPPYQTPRGKSAEWCHPFNLDPRIVGRPLLLEELGSPACMAYEINKEQAFKILLKELQDKVKGVQHVNV